MACAQPVHAPHLSQFKSAHTMSQNPPPYFDLFPPTPKVPPPSNVAGPSRVPLDEVLGSEPTPASAPQSRSNAGDLSIDHLREALHSLESRVASLLNERELLEFRLESAVRLQSPVQRLPSELLASIFVTGVTDGGEEEDSLTLSTIMLVCQHWKEVALDTPTLWTRVIAGTRHSLVKVARKLERSKSAPLHVSVDFSPKVENGTVSTESIVRAMDLLRTSVWRWKTFRLVVPNRPQANAALLHCDEPAPLLEVLSIRVLHSMQEDHYYAKPPHPFDGQTPSLTFCTLSSFNFGWDLRLVSHLRTLTLSGYWNGFSPSADVILGILRACPHLEELALRNMSDVEVGSCTGAQQNPSGYDDANERVRVSDTRMINLPRLKKAIFYYAGTLRARTILSLMNCPALEEVDLCFLDNVNPIIDHLYRQSLTRLPLRKLRIESGFFSELKLGKFLKHVPSLVSLELVDIEDASTNLLKSLSVPPNSNTMTCPNLRAVSFEGWTSLEWDSLRSFVEARLPAQSRAYARPLVMRESSSTTSTASKPRVYHPPPSSSSSSSSSASAAILSSSSASASVSSSSSSSSTSTSSSSASAYAATGHILTAPAAMSSSSSSSSSASSVFGPQRLETIDLTRCHQITREMVQWLRMYVADVRCDAQRVVWGE